MNSARLFISICLFAPLSIHAQEDVRAIFQPHFNTLSEGKFVADNFLRKMTGKALINSPGTADFEGTPYLQNEFETAYLVMHNAVYRDLPVRYNIYADQMELMQQGLIFALIPDERVKWVVFPNSAYTLQSYPFKGKLTKGFLEVIDSGAVTIFAKKVVIFKERQEPSGMQYSSIPARFERLADVYFIRTKDDTLEKLPTLKKTIAMLPGNKIELQSYAKQEHLSNTPGDVVKLLKYFNRLQKK
jgi:hypothetical protein